MKRLVTAVFVAVLLVSMVPGASTALARDEEDATDVAIATGTESGNVTTSQVYAVDDATMDELDRLILLLREAEEKGDRELVKALEEKIRIIKAEIERASQANTSVTTTRNTPTVVAIAVPGKPQVVEEKPTTDTASTGTTGTVTVSNTASSCNELKAVEEKYNYYRRLYGLSDEELISKGYQRGRAEIEAVLKELNEMIVRLRAECEAGNTNRTGSEVEGKSWTSTAGISKATISAKPVAVESAVEITDYYKRRIAEIVTEEVDIDKKITALKELRDEIDRLIEALIKSKDAISTSEVKGLVEKIEVRPGQVRMDKVTVATTDKIVRARIKNTDLEIKPTSARVVVNDGALEVKATEVSIENDVLKVGDVEVVLMPSAALANVEAAPEEIELTQENARPVYRIKIKENRKLFGFIPLKMDNTITVDASTSTGEIIKEQRPWWAFLTTGGE